MNESGPKNQYICPWCGQPSEDREEAISHFNSHKPQPWYKTQLLNIRMVHEIPDELIYRGYTLHWTGWKEEQASFNIGGQWYAMSEHGRRGDVPFASYGTDADLAREPKRKLLTPECLRGEAEEARLQCLADLKALIDTNAESLGFQDELRKK